MIEVAGRRLLFDKGVGPDAVQVGRQRGPLDHREDSGRDRVVLDRDTGRRILLFLGDAAAGLLEELGDAGRQFDAGTEFLQLGGLDG